MIIIVSKTSANFSISQIGTQYSNFQKYCPASQFSLGLINIANIPQVRIQMNDVQNYYSWEQPTLLLSLSLPVTARLGCTCVCVFVRAVSFLGRVWFQFHDVPKPVPLFSVCPACPHLTRIRMNCVGVHCTSRSPSPVAVAATDAQHLEPLFHKGTV